MAIVTLKELLTSASEKKVSVGAFSVGNMEMVLGAVRAAEELNTPIILQIAEVRLPTSPLDIIGPMMVAASENSEVDICVHLDHGLNYETVEQALDLGFSSVMLDGSLLPIEENKEKNRVHRRKNPGLCNRYSDLALPVRISGSVDLSDTGFRRGRTPAELHPRP